MLKSEKIVDQSGKHRGSAEIAGLDIAGLDIDGRVHRGGHCILHDWTMTNDFTRTDKSKYHKR